MCMSFTLRTSLSLLVLYHCIHLIVCIINIFVSVDAVLYVFLYSTCMHASDCECVYAANSCMEEWSMTIEAAPLSFSLLLSAPPTAY